MGGGADAGVGAVIGHDVQDEAGVVFLARGRYIPVDAGGDGGAGAGALEEDGGRALAGGFDLDEGVGVVQGREQEELGAGVEFFQLVASGDEATHDDFVLKALFTDELREAFFVLTFSYK